MKDPLLFSDWLELEESWIDYNGHLNMGYYTVLFDRAADQSVQIFGFGPDYKARTGHSTFAAEFHIRYLREVKMGSRVRASYRIIGYDEKRWHTFQELYHEDGWLAATGEGLGLHVDLSGPRVAPMPPDVLDTFATVHAVQRELPLPGGIGGRIGMRKPG